MSASAEKQLVTILLATYNGEKYIQQQLDSLLAQTHSNWVLYIRDDHSTDNTPQILLEYQHKHINKIFIINDLLGNLGSTQNFNTLLKAIPNDKYVMFCDQDDFWLPNKIANSLNEMLAIEKDYGIDTPLLVYTNFRYVDANLKEIDSKKGFQATKVLALGLQHIIAQNPIYGCTVIINNALMRLIKDIPKVAENHDYWIALVASALGKIHYLNEQTLCYRQHGNNISGNHNDNSIIRRFNRIIIQNKNLFDAKNKIAMAKKLKEIYVSKLSPMQVQLIDNFINFAKKKSLSLFFLNIKGGIRKQTAGQTFVFYSSIFFLKE